MSADGRVARTPLARALTVAIRFYQRWISPNLPPTCRFYPSCSAYAAEAIEVHGAVRGTGLAVRRLLRCHPWHPGGLDPVPPRAVGRRKTCHADCTEKCEEQAPC